MKQVILWTKRCFYRHNMCEFIDKTGNFIHKACNFIHKTDDFMDKTGNFIDKTGKISFTDIIIISSKFLPRKAVDVTTISISDTNINKLLILKYL